MTAIKPPVCAACGQTLPGRPDLSNPESETVTEALSRSCDICRAPVGQPCANVITPGSPIPGRIVHLGRTEPR